MLQTKTTEPIVVWRPIPNSSQELALDTRCHHTLFTGSRGPGKSDTQLMRFRRRVGLGYGEFWRGVIFDREYKHLDDLVSKSKRWFNKFNDGAEFKSATSAYKWVWPTGEELLFRVMEKVKDYDNYHGQEYPYIGWNELTKYATSAMYDMMMSCNRSSFTPEKDSPKDKNGVPLLGDIPLEVFSTCNSYGPGHGWVKEQFIDPAPYGQVIRRTFRVFNPRTQQEEDVVRTQVAIFGSYKENIYLDPAYIAGLSTIKDKNILRSWLKGDWDIVAGGAFDDLWRKSVHVVPRFKIPAGWYLDRSFDWGSTDPFSVGFWAEADGTEAELEDGTTFCPARGSLIRFHEYYGTLKIGTNKGIKMSSGNIAVNIRRIETELLEAGWIENQPWPGPADNQIRDCREDDVETIEKKMSDKGVRWTHSDKSPGSRRNGFELFRTRLENATTGEGPAIYFMDHCRAAIVTVPTLPRDETFQDDVDTTAEDHPWDEIRYRVLKGANRLATKVPFKFVN